MVTNKDANRLDEYNEYLATLHLTDEVPLENNRFFSEISKIFGDCADFLHRNINLPNDQKMTIYFFLGLADNQFLQTSVIKPLSELEDNELGTGQLRDHITNPRNRNVSDWNDIIYVLLSGGAICHWDGHLPLEINVPSNEKRSITEPTTQYQIFGPKIGFIEDIQTNIAIMRKFLKDPRLKTINYEIGSLSHTRVTVMYIEGYADNSNVERLKQRIKNVKVDHLITMGQLNKQLIDYPKSIFPQVYETERPDNVAFALGEGKLAIFIDNTTFCSILPIALFDLYLSGDDRSFSSFYNALFLRTIRYLCMVISTALPALYVALVAFHPELIPETLALTIAASRSQIPFPAAAEAIIMMIALDVLVEASTRLPSFVGQTIGIVGGLVIGTAAVEAGVISSLMVIVIAFTAVASFTTPTWELVSSLRVIRYGFLIISALFGLYGFVLGFCLTFIHICNIESFSRPYISPLSPLKMEQFLTKFHEKKAQLLAKKGG